MPCMTRWIDTVVAQAAFASGANSATSLLSGIGPVDTRGVTIIRTMIRLSFSSDTIAGAWGAQSVHLGIGIASQAAFTMGITALPTAEGSEQPARGWIWRDHVMAGQNGVDTQFVSTLREDIRGARKIEDGEVFLTFSNIPHTGTPFSIRVTGLVRLLVKLP